MVAITATPCMRATAMTMLASVSRSIGPSFMPDPRSILTISPVESTLGFEFALASSTTLPRQRY